MPHEHSVLMHNHFEDAYKLVYSFANYGEPGHVCFVAGASGAGKTTLIQLLATELFNESVQEEKIPLISLTANLSQQGRFSQKNLIFDIFAALHDPFRSDPFEVLPRDILTTASDKIDDLAEWRWTSIIERLAKAYGLVVLIIDEGQLMCLAPGRHSPSDYVESLRVLAMKAKIRIIIAGTYDMLEVWNYSSHINRRSITVNINRYDKTKKEMAQFLGVLKGIELQCSLPSKLLTEHASECYEWSCGVPGEVFSQVMRAKLKWKASDSDIVLWKHFESSKHLPSQLSLLKLEVDAGEAILFAKDSAATEHPHQQVVNSPPKNKRKSRSPIRSAVGMK